MTHITYTDILTGSLDDGSGNPPDGWDNPEQMGTITRVDETTLIFTDEVGHREGSSSGWGRLKPSKAATDS